MKIEFRASGKSKSVDLAGIGVFETEKVPSKAASEHLDKTKFSGKAGETYLVTQPPGKVAKAHLLIGLGKRERFSLQSARLASARLVSQAKALRYASALLELDSLHEKFPIEDIAAACVEGARMTDYRFDKYKSKPAPKKTFETLALVSRQSARARSIQKSMSDSEIISEGVILVRDIANEPANILTPKELANIAKFIARKNNLSCKVLGRAEMKKLGMGAVLGVAQGSAQEPQFVILENRPKNARRKDPIVLVGKGVTFDTGGISIKPAGDMDKMKFDMCGAAAVIAAMKVIANLKLPIRVIGLTPLVENMPGGNAQRPGDIVKAMNGKTIEVLNTDAEGRLILADALSYAKRYKPMAMVNIATLTGACAATFGDAASGLMSTDPDVADRLKRAGERTGERLWEMPLWDEYAELIRGTYADVQNISRRAVGIMTAGLFLREFADHTKAWAHLDVAGTAWADNPKLLTPVGATGMGVRLFTEFVKSYL